jgi:hypothetical protein
MKEWLVMPSRIRDVLAGWFVVLLLAAAIALGPFAHGEREQAATGPEVLPPTHWTLHARAAIPAVDDEAEERETYRAVGSGIVELPPVPAETTAMTAMEE